MATEELRRNALPTDPIPINAVPAQTRRELPALAGRLARQLEAVDAWNAQRRLREALLTAGPATRDERMHRTRRLAALLEEHGVLVLDSTDDGADALGAVVAEQPDIVLSGDRLAMMSGQVLLDETRLFSPQTRRALHTSRADPPVGLDLHAVFLGHRPPVDIADGLAAIVRTGATFSRST